MSHTNWKTQLNDAGLRATPTAIALLAILEAIPLSTADELHGQLQERDGLQPDRVTVYRLLNRLTERKLITAVSLGNRATQYELADSHHHHAICTSCQTVEHVELPNHLDESEQTLKRSHDFHVLRHELEFYGICQRCQTH